MTLRHWTLTVSAAYCLAIALSGCGSSRVREPRIHFEPFDRAKKAEYLAAKPGEYRIQEGDELAVTFPFDKDLNSLGIIVLPDGSITLAGVDRIVVAGRTVSEADSLVTAEYAKSYRNPDLSVLVEKTVGRQIYVLGEVEHPGVHTVPHGGISILSAIGAAGGFTEDAAESGTVLVRLNEAGYFCQEIDLSRFHTVESIAIAGVGLEPYDVIYVPRSRIGDFAYFSRTVLTGLVNLSRIATDVRYNSDIYRR